jgi:hypothetical protein
VAPNIVSPFGDLLAGPAYGSEQILTTEVDLGEIVRGKFDLDVVGHYSRPDIFQLHVDEKAQRIFSSTSDSVVESDSRDSRFQGEGAKQCPNLSGSNAPSRT